MPRVLVIDDDPAILELVAFNLDMSGYEVIEAPDGHKGQAFALQMLPDLIVLDLMLPQVDGLTICQRLRRDERTAEIPILMLTALGQIKDKVGGFNAGADDYMTKPFEIEELLVRVRALLRRTDRMPQAARHAEILSLGPLTLIPERFECIWFNKPIKLTHLEFELLHCLLQRHGQTVSPSEILREVWGTTRTTTSRLSACTSATCAPSSNRIRAIRSSSRPSTVPATAWRFPRPSKTAR